MKNIVLLLTLIFSLDALAGLPPTTLNSQQSSVKITTFNAYVPNNQATKITGGTLIESGNKNLLANPSFESPLVGGVIPSWNFGALAPVLEISSTVIDGKQLALFNAAADTVLLTQTSTLYASAFALGGTQGLATCRINSTAALKMCTISNSVTSTSNCVDVNADGKWGLYKIPVILGTGNNGISIASTGAVTGTVYVDDCFLGAQDLKQDSSAIGPWINFTPTGSWTTNTTYNGKYRQVGDSYEYNIQVATTGAPTAAALTVNLPHTIDVTKLNSTSAGNEILGTSKALDVGVNEYTPGYVRYNTTTSVDVRFSGSASVTASLSNSAPFSFGTGDSVSLIFRAPVVSLSSSVSTYSSTNADTDWASCGHTTSDFTGFGTVSAIETQCKRQGSDLLMRGKFTVGTTTAVEARLNLKLNGATLTSANTSKIPSLQIAGDAATGGFSSTYFRNSVLIEPSVAYVTFGTQTNTLAAGSKVTGSGLITSGYITLNARIPIAGWDNSNQIIGSFKEVPTTIGSSGADIQSVYFGGSADCSTACTTGNCTICHQTGTKITTVSFVSSGTYDLNGIDGTKYDCSGTGTATNNSPITHRRSVSTSTKARVVNGVSTADNASNASVTCTGIP